MSKMINCKDCGKEISSSAKFCPGCGAKNKKPIYKRQWFIVLALMFIIGSTNSDNDSTVNNNVQENKQEYAQNKDQESTQNKDLNKDIPTEYKSALRQAETYSDMMHMSKAGIYDQLTSEYGGQFSNEAAQYAIDNIDADWNKNALESAKTYQGMMAMSPKAIYDQLTSEYGGQFTKEEAQYAIDNLN